MDTKTIVLHLAKATPKELGVMLHKINERVFADNEWNSYSVKAEYHIVINEIDTTLDQLYGMQIFGTLDMRLGNDVVPVSKAISNLNIAKGFFTNPPTINNLNEKELCHKIETDNNVNEKEDAKNESTPLPRKSDVQIISGTQGLADYLGCGKTLAFSIIKSKVLQEENIQYMVGKCWKFKRQGLDDYLKKNPQLIPKNRCK